jgi:hypothetical protein
MEKIAHYGCFFECEKIHEQIPIITNIFLSFCYVTIFVTSSCKLEMYFNQPLNCSNVQQFYNIIKV